MGKEHFTIEPIWDDECDKWYSVSNVKGLHIETFTLEEFYKESEIFGKELIKLNHYRNEDMTDEEMYSKCDYTIIRK